MAVQSFMIAVTTLSLFCQSVSADAPKSEIAALKKLRGMTTNVQFHRDKSVRLIRFSKPIVADKTLEPVREFSKIEYLAIVCPNVTDAGLKHIERLTNLDTLLLSGTSITNDGLKHLAGLKKLERLYLANTAITDGGLRHLHGLQNLKTLWLEGTSVGDRGLVTLSKLKNLEVLVLADTKVSDAGLLQLANLPQLKVLDLSGCAITGSGLANLNTLKQLQHLQLTGTKLSDKTLKGLSTLRHLKQVELYRTAVTRDAVKQLRTKMPRTGFAVSSGINVKSLTKPVGGSVSKSVVPQESVRPLPAVAARMKADPKFTPDFQRHVIPLLGRLGCNGRSCHGSFQGRGGFRLSMFGYDFAMDHKNLVARVDRKSPSKSLIVNKPTSKENHEGGLKLPPGGWEQSVLRRWIAGGAKPVVQNGPKFVRLEITPKEVVFRRAGQTQALKVVAVWSDGTHEDVTALTRFSTKDDNVADVSPQGVITAKAAGDTHILAAYDNGLVATPVIRPESEFVGDRYPKVPTPTRIDELVVAKLRKLGVRPSALCTDEEFLRRVCLDMIGTLPTPKEIREFLADKSPDKRAKKIDELLNRPAYVTLWTTRLCDLTGSNAGYLGGTEMARPVAQQWEAWMQRRVRDNIGWDRIVADIVLASSRKPGQPYREFIAQQSLFTRRKNPTDFTAIGNPMPHFWYRDNIRRPADKALAFGFIFLGVKLDCAQCHKHPFDQWSKKDFEQFTQFFTRIKAGIAPDAAQQRELMRAMLGVPTKLNTAALRRQSYLRIAAEGRPIPWKEIYIEAPKGKPHIARLLNGPEIDLNDYEDPRIPLMQWLRTEPNRYLARAFVNRIWANYFNVGIVTPTDDLNRANPPSNGPLLQYLTEEFIKHNYDMKWLHRTIANSRTYQLSWRANTTNRNDQRNFSRAVFRRLPAEVAIDAMIQSTGNYSVLKGYGDYSRTRKIGQHPKSYQTRSIDYSLLIFGKSLRTTNCDCEMRTAPTLPQALYIQNDNEMFKRLDRADGWLAELRKRPPTKSKIDQLIESAYLRTLSRKPSKAELTNCRNHVLNAETILDGHRDILWALLNTKEFITNH